MPKYDADVQEKAYQLHMIEQKTIKDTVAIMKHEHPAFSHNPLLRWKASPVLDWDGRYQRYIRAAQDKTDKALMKKITPIINVIQEIREQTYLVLREVIRRESVTEKNLGPVLMAFVKMGELEFKMTGGSKSNTPINHVVNMLIMVLEKDPVLGPLLSTRKIEISEAVFEMITSENEKDKK